MIGCPEGQPDAPGVRRGCQRVSAGKTGTPSRKPAQIWHACYPAAGMSQIIDRRRERWAYRRGIMIGRQRSIGMGDVQATGSAKPDVIVIGAGVAGMYAI